VLLSFFSALTLLLKLQEGHTACQGYNNNISSNNKDDNVYGAVIVAKAPSRVHPVHMMNMEWRQVAANPQPRPNDPGCESACRLHVGCKKPHLPSPFILLLTPKADTHFTILRRVEG